MIAPGLSATAAMAEFPEKEIQGIIQWGAGGSTDTVMRAVKPHAERVPGGSIVMDPLTFTERFTFDLPLMRSGILFIALMIGMFGVSEVLNRLHHIDTPAIKQKIGRIVPSWGVIRKHLSLGLQSSGIGVIIGALPGLAGTSPR